MKHPSPVSRVGKVRYGGVSLPLIGGLSVATLLLGVGAWYWKPWQSKQTFSTTVLTQPVKRDLFIYEVTEQGEIESSSNVEVACEVQSKNSGGTTIIEIVPEGTNVKPGDFLVRLDASALREELSQQQIVCNASEAAVIQAENTLRTAQINRQEYLEGTFRQEEQIILSEMSVAEENLRRAEDYARHSEKLAAKGYVTPLQLEADKFAVEKAKMDLETAKTKLNVLRNYTREKMLSQLEADIKTAEANLKSQQNTHALDLDKLKHVQEQIAKCEITAPAEGQVVYANKSDRRGSSDVIIEAGSSVRERQVIIRLPDPKRMQVKAKINESRVDRVRPGQPATIRLDAFPDIELTGTVTRVDDYPLAGSWFTSSIKEYGTIIQIDEPPPGSRPGMTAEVKIRVEEVPNALQIPVQAVVERGGRHFALVKEGDELKSREIQIGSTNDKFVVVREGLQADEQVVVNPRRHLDRVDLPAAPPAQNRELLAQKRKSGNAERSKSHPDSTPAQVPLASADSPVAAADADRAAQRERRARGDGATGGGMNFDPAAIWNMILARMDKNNDAKLSADEVDERMRSTFPTSDTNGDGFIDRDEMMAAMARRMAAGGGPRGAAGGGPGAVAAPNAGQSGL
jgi:RND family efflux transporter MFP subunit